LLLDNGYPAASISVVEALRYMYLHDLRGTSESSSGHLLLLGDFLEHANEVLVKVFREAMAQLPEHRAIKVRSHPICPLTPDQLGPLTANVSSDPLATLLRTTSVVITTAASSSAAESAALGIPTIVILDARSLNYSPFRQTDNVYVVENATQLAQLLENEVQLKPQPVDTIFCLDPQYPRWRMELNPT
jgi:surface carbohydrate biosynthesis protein (TIGR04326 family)